MVWTRHLVHKRIVQCKIIEVKKIPLCIVKFNDGSISDDIKVTSIKVVILFILSMQSFKLTFYYK